MSHCL